MANKAPATQPRVFFLGVFPPPTHGASLINQRMEQEFVGAGHEVRRLDVVSQRSAQVGSRPLYLLLKTGNVLLLWLSFVVQGLRGGRRLLYVSTAGGYGQVFELPFLLTARVLRIPVWYHHHSFQYLRHRRFLTAVSFSVAGAKTNHIALCKHMRACLADLYGIDRNRIRVLSNSGLLAMPQTRPVTIRRHIFTLGFLSNISFPKGIRQFIELCDALHREAIDYRARIAGPFTSSKVERYVNDAIANNPKIEYLGPQYGDAKIAFLDTIDLLVFPSQYSNEAEPLVIHEAHSRGIYVFAINGGCIGEVLQNSGGEILDAPQFVERAAIRISELQQNPALVKELSRTSISSMRHRAYLSKQAVNSLLAELS